MSAASCPGSKGEGCDCRMNGNDPGCPWRLTPVAPAANPLEPSVGVLVKLGSALVHAEEFTEPGAHPFDLDAFKRLASDPEIVAWREAMDAMALLPVKR